MSQTNSLTCEAAAAEFTPPVNLAGGSSGRAASARNVVRNFCRGSVMATVSTAFGQFAIYAVQGIILARMLGPQARGEYGTAVLYTYTLMTIGLFGTSYAVTRRAARQPQGHALLTRTTVRLGILTGFCTLAIVAALSVTTLPGDKSFLWPLCIVTAVCLPFEHTRLLLLAVDCGSSNFRRYNVNQLFTAAVFPLALAIAWCFGAKSIGMVAVLTSAGPILGLAARFIAEKTPRLYRGPRVPEIKTLLREGGPYVVSVASGDLFGRLDALLFVWLASFTAQGYYAAAVASASLLVTAPNALAMFTFNLGARAEERFDRKSFFWGGLGIFGFQAVSAGALAIIIRPLITFVYGSAFVGAVPLALALIPAQAINGFVAVVDGYLRGRGRVAVATYARCAGAVAMVGTALLLNGQFHELSIPIAASLARLVVAIVLVWVAIKDVARVPTESALVTSAASAVA